MKIYKLKKDNLTQIESKPFKLEKDIQGLVENNIEELFNLRLVRSEFRVGVYRIDSLCFDDESKSFVIIEYKKGKSYSVIDQGYTYLSTMLNNKSDFVLELHEHSQKYLKKDEIDWSQSKVLFVSTSFNSYQKDSLNFKDVPFELWEVKKFSDGLVGFDQIISTSQESIKNIGEKSKLIHDVGKEVKVYDEETHLSNSNKKISDLYLTIKEKLMEWEGVSFKPKKNHIGVWKNDTLGIYLNLQKNNIKIHILRMVIDKTTLKQKRKLFSLKDPNKMFKLIKRSGTKTVREYYECYVNEKSDLNYLILLLKQRYDYL